MNDKHEDNNLKEISEYVHYGPILNNRPKKKKKKKKKKSAINKKNVFPFIRFRVNTVQKEIVGRNANRRLLVIYLVQNGGKK